MTSRVLILAVTAAAVAGGCEKPHRAERLPLDQILVSDNAMLRTSPVGGAMDPGEIKLRDKLGETRVEVGEGEAVTASYVLVDAENRTDRDANVTLGGTLRGGDQTAPLKAESLFVPAGGTRTFLLLDAGLQPRPWATGVKVVVTGASVAKYPPPMDITEVNVFTDGDHVVLAARVASTVKRPGRGIVLAAFHDAEGKPVARGHALVSLQPGTSDTFRFVGPRGSKTATVFAGDSTF